MLIRISMLMFFLVASACTQQGFYLPEERQVFQQNRASINKVVDILWVVDNSSSMQSSQDALGKNLKSFIDKFDDRGLNFQMAFTTTDAYRASFNANPQLSIFKDGSDSTGHSGIKIITNNTPNINNIFLTNAQVGINGDGDERAFISIKETLTNAANQNFLRPNSFFSVIIISDEDDFSWDGSDSLQGNIRDSRIHTVDRYVDFLKSFTFSTQPNDNKFSVSAITILDQACYDILHANTTGQKIGYRYMDLVKKTGGTLASLCSDFSNSLDSISGKILELITQFKLNRIPDIETIKVFVDDKEVIQGETNGWTYDAVANAITFHGAAVPGEGQKVAIDFMPLTAK